MMAMVTWKTYLLTYLRMLIKSGPTAVLGLWGFVAPQLVIPLVLVGHTCWGCE